MKITIELEGFAVKVLVTLSIAAWCTWKGQPEAVQAIAGLIAALKL